MFNHRHYVPVLKLKRGERKALDRVNVVETHYITPLLEIAEADFVPSPGTTVDPEFDARIEAIGANVAQCWPSTGVVFVDGNLMDPSARTAGGQHPMTKAFDSLRAAGVMAVPVTGIGRDPAYQQAVAAISVVDGRGVVIRVTLDDTGSPQFSPLLATLLTDLALAPSECHLVLDVGELNGVPASLVMGIQLTINNFPHLNQWQSFTLCAAAFPRDLASVSLGVDFIPRADWLLYMRLVATGLARVPTFGDYATRHPELFEGDGRVINASASIRYTIDNDWLVVRGMGVRTRGSGGFAQFCQNAAILRARPEFCGPAFSVGDQEIDAMGQRSTNCGNLETWVWIGVNHHITFVARQILSVPASPFFP